MLLLLCLFFTVALAHPATAQVQEDCGIVDAIDFPIDGVSLEHDDFGLYRAAFGGRHTGIDMAFGRYGDPVRAAARGRVTFSDVAGWGDEKGVIIIEHKFPDGSTYFSLYGHVEPYNGRPFPPVSQCVRKDDIIAAVGNPALSATHLHYEIRRMRASTGGPGYWPVDPLDGGWEHPIDFTERWRLRLNPAYRGLLTAASSPITPPLWQPDGGAIFAQDQHLEQRDGRDASLWRVDVRGLVGIIQLADGRVLARTVTDQILIVDRGRFVASWNADRPLRSPPFRLGDAIAFLAEDNRVITYTVQGALRWQTAPLGQYLERGVQSGDQLAVTGEQDGVFKLWIVDSAGKIAYQASAPAPITALAAPDGFLVLVTTQVGRLGADLAWKPLIDAGQPLGRSAQIAIDTAGNIVLYPGLGRQILAFSASGALRWQATLPSLPTQPPLLAVGAGCLVYVLTADGALMAYRASDGALRGTATLYPGGPHGYPASRFVRVLSGEQVQFSAGYLTVATVDGPTLANMACPAA